MILNIYAIRDQQTDQFGNPMFLTATGQAIRSFMDEINRVDPQNILNKHPEDFELFHLGTYDTEKATFNTHTPKSVINGKSAMAATK